MRKFIVPIINLGFVIALGLVVACGDSDEPQPVFGIAFETTALGIDPDASEVEVKLSFTVPTTVQNTATIDISETGVTYGQEYTTDASVSNGELTLTIPAGATDASFIVRRLATALDGGSEVSFTLSAVEGETDPQIVGNTIIKVSFDAIAFVGTIVFPNIGGPTEPNQVFIDLSLNLQANVARDSWDLGFYSGADSRVVVNYSTYGMAQALEINDLNSVSSADTVGFSAQMRIGTAGANVFVDNPNGDLLETVVAEVSDTDSENKVYILNRGNGPGSSAVDPGSVRVDEVVLGWKKIRILKRGTDYLLQYADINATSFSEVTIYPKNGYNFNHFSFASDSEVGVEPEEDKWDLVFSVASRVIDFGAGLGAYGFSDVVKTNRVGGTEVALVELERDDNGVIVSGQTTYDDFTASDVNGVGFSEDATTIGSSWRSVFSRTAYDYRFYIVKDAEGNYYKIQFLGLLSQTGARGNSSFKYELL